MTSNILGVDIGGVIIAGTEEHKDTFFNRANYLETPAVEGAFEGLQELVDKHFHKRVYLVSKGGRHTEVKTREWLAHHDFYRKAGVREKHVNFCKERKDKADRCRQLGVTHFIDDLLEVLGYLHEAGIKNLYLLNPHPNGVEEYKRYLRHVQPVASWKDTVEMMLRSVE